jgi:tRNA-2-methylthio-N6-dimethylallyladenosine synthase
VRESAELRVLGKLGELKRMKRDGKNLFIVLAGCMVGADTSDLHKRLPHVDAFIKPSDTSALIAAVAEHFAIDLNTQLDSCHGVSGEIDDEDDHVKQRGVTGQVARWVPIIFGCDNFCSYCIVPYRRGRERSRPMLEIVDEVRGYVAEGTREVTLLGQNVDSYGHDLPDKPDLATLLTELHKIEGLDRIRFLTSHPKDMSERLIEAVASLPKVCEHINLPVQHGDDDVLQEMRRGYTSGHYRELVGRLRSRVPELSLSTDIIVGYPGETSEQFQRTYDLVRELCYDVVHVAAYSPRPGTIAARLPDDVPVEEKKRRLALIEKLQEEVVARTNAALVGTDQEVLIEGQHKGKWQGRTRSNKLVFVASEQNLQDQMVTVKVEKATAWSLQGVLVSEGVACS